MDENTLFCTRWNADHQITSEHSDWNNKHQWNKIRNQTSNHIFLKQNAIPSVHSEANTIRKPTLLLAGLPFSCFTNVCYSVVAQYWTDSTYLLIIYAQKDEKNQGLKTMKWSFNCWLISNLSFLKIQWMFWTSVASRSAIKQCIKLLNLYYLSCVWGNSM